mmetsp:Transcript_25183/g.69449  ORF Transcript_25183/g.69449 Transcript_25183/m.69449 type:complete len:281 (-) Transcript_25183:310-1152(-)|eukprot:CAMPEP_0172367062 /NCGR_PEP_ID=MMETSP1060-20121228/18731_1 /TAXON_ID=37318 /ORGANISM="Pseudo-nitzschia pungens, Strain cf. cingulata" /LENGTH=280 /DNA_ID=CAMNT_0013091143 /DNA_START=86 /DNA_END=928 /DNA_ORIENTATION=+
MHGLSQPMKLVLLGFIVAVAVVVDYAAAFSPPSKSSSCSIHSLSKPPSLSPFGRNRNSDANHKPMSIVPTATTRTTSTSSTSLNVLLDVPDHFFVFYFPMLGVLLDLSKKFARYRLEETAWEQRLKEAREKRLREDPTLTEIELRRKEAALEWSAYGKPRRQEEERERATREEMEGSFGSKRNRVKVMERDYEDDYDDAESRTYQMSDAEIDQFELEYGVEYDPYYDDPYTEDELPDDINFNVDKKYGDRIYDNGEIFYKAKESGLFYRQGAKPRNLSFW